MTINDPDIEICKFRNLNRLWCQEDVEDHEEYSAIFDFLCDFLNEAKHAFAEDLKNILWLKPIFIVGIFIYFMGW